MITEVFTFPARWRAAAAVVALSLVAGCAESEFGAQASRPTTASERISELRGDLKRNPNDTVALKEIGDMRASMGQWGQSMGAYREALLISPSDREARLGLGEGQLAVGDYAGALKTVEQAGGKDTRSMLLRAGALAGLDRLTEARAVLTLAGAAAPRNLDVRINTAIVAALSRDPQAYAIARAAAFAPDANPSHWRNMVLVGGISGQDTVARQDALQLGLGSEEIGDILAVGRRARTQGVRAFGVAVG